MNITVFKHVGRAGPHVMQDYAEAFAELGHQVSIVSIADAYQKLSGELAAEHINARRFAGKYFELYGRPDLVVGYGSTAIWKTFEHDGRITNIFDMHKIPIAAIFWDSPMGDDHISMISAINSNQYHMFIWDMYYVLRMKFLGIKNAYYSPCAVNPKKFFKLDGCKINHACVFAGSYSPQREMMVRALLDGGVAIEVFGEAWQPEENNQPHCYDQRILDVYRGKIPQSALNALFNTSMVAVNMTMEQGLTSLNMRAFEVAAAGTAAFVTDEKADIPKLGFNFQQYRGLHDIVPAVKQILFQPAERQEATGQNYQAAHGLHTFGQRAENILQTIFPEQFPVETPEIAEAESCV